MVAQRKQGRADVGLGRAGEGGRGARGGGFFFAPGGPCVGGGPM